MFPLPPAPVPAKTRKNSRWWLSLSAVLVSLLLAELGMRLFIPQFRLPYAHASFSPRYHHTSPEFSSLLEQIQSDPRAFKGDITVAILGDSFVAGEEVDHSRRFTSIMQAYCDSLPAPRIKILNLGFTSYSTFVYARLYRDVILPLDPDIVIVCLDQSDAVDDYLYEQELSSGRDTTGLTLANAEFKDTVLKNYESYPITFFLLRHSRLFLLADMAKQRLTGIGFIPKDTRLQIPDRLRVNDRDRKRLKLYLETCRAPESYGDFFESSEKYIQAISSMKPMHQKLYFVTYPRAENLAGQRKSTILRRELPDSHASTPYFEFWIEESNLAARYLDISFVHTADVFRAAIASSGRQYYFLVNDLHWNEEGHKLFAEILEHRIIANAEAMHRTQ
jgi:lysophospholipase L1-like esterase